MPQQTLAQYPRSFRTAAYPVIAGDQEPFIGFDPVAAHALSVVEHPSHILLCGRVTFLGDGWPVAGRGPIEPDGMGVGARLEIIPCCGEPRCR